MLPRKCIHAFLGSTPNVRSTSLFHGSLSQSAVLQKVKSKGIPVTGRGGPQGCEKSEAPTFLDNRPTGGGEVVSLMRRPPFTPRKISGTHFC
jgi:hypothetical protein